MKLLKQAIAGAIAKTDHNICNLYAKKVGLPTDFEYRNDDSTRAQLIPEPLRLNSEERKHNITVPIEYLHVAPQHDIEKKKKKATAVTNGQTPTQAEAILTPNEQENAAAQVLQPINTQHTQQQQASPQSHHCSLREPSQLSTSHSPHSQSPHHLSTCSQTGASPTRYRTRGRSAARSSSCTPPACRMR